jgi:hypothetical protein
VRPLFVLALLAALLLLGRHFEEVRGRTAPARAGAAAVAGRSRAVDMEKLKEAIERGRLSDREARYYHRQNRDDRPHPP